MNEQTLTSQSFSSALRNTVVRPQKNRKTAFNASELAKFVRAKSLHLEGVMVTGDVVFLKLKKLNLTNVQFVGNVGFADPITEVVIRDCSITGEVEGSLTCRHFSGYGHSLFTASTGQAGGNSSKAVCRRNIGINRQR